MSAIVRNLQLETAATSAFIASLKAEFGDDDELVADMVEGNTNIRELITAAALRVGELEFAQQAIKDTVAKMRQRSTRFERQINALREAIRLAMSSAELSKLELPEATVSLSNAPRRLRVIDEALIPADYWKQPPPELDRRKLADALKTNSEIPGAALDNGGETLRILTN